MKTLRLIAISFILATFFAISALAQVTTKVALVDTDAFYAKGGITKIENGYKSLKAEFTTLEKELNTMNIRKQALEKELQTLQQQANDPNNKVPINKTQVQAKVDEYEKLQVDLKRKQEDAKARYEKREQAVIGPILQDVGKVLENYAKEKGYSMILDVGKLFETRIVLYWEPTTEVTKDFITYYNSRPGGTATTKPE